MILWLGDALSMRVEMNGMAGFAVIDVIVGFAVIAVIAGFAGFAEIDVSPRFEEC